MTPTCPECGGAMLVSKKTQRLGDDPPDPSLEEPENQDYAREDVDQIESITAKRAVSVCGRCGSTAALPDL